MLMICIKFGYTQIYDVRQGNYTKKKSLPVFIKAVVFHHVGFSWMISMKEQYDFYVDEHDEEWCPRGPWCIETTFQSLHVPLFA